MNALTILNDQLGHYTASLRTAAGTRRIELIAVVDALTDAIETINEAKADMPLAQRAEENGMNLDEKAYRLCLGDAAGIVEDNTTAEQQAAFTDEQLDDCIRAVARSFEHIDWNYAGQDGLFTWLDDNGFSESEGE